MLNLSTLSEVRISNFEYVYRVTPSEKLVRKSKVTYMAGEYVDRGLTVLAFNLLLGQSIASWRSVDGNKCLLQLFMPG
jgi:hypothetical protein